MPFTTRHKAPVLEVAWQPSGTGTTDAPVLHSLCGGGRLLRWLPAGNLVGALVNLGMLLV